MSSEGRFTRFNPATAVASRVIGGYLIVCLLLTVMGLIVTHQLGALTRWDRDVARWFSENRTIGMNDWTAYVTRVADTFGILIVLLAAVIILLLLQRRWEALSLALALGLELLAFLAVNYLIGRPRPEVVRLGSLPSTSSFPSGHTAAMAALYGGLAVIMSAELRSRVLGMCGQIVALLTTAMVGAGRVYRGMHYPSDVVAGALLGFAVLGVALLAVRAGQAAAARREQPHPPIPEPPLEPKVAV
jgi:undecaprenyl-diphosphatase